MHALIVCVVYACTYFNGARFSEARFMVGFYVCCCCMVCPGLVLVSCWFAQVLMSVCLIWPGLDSGVSLVGPLCGS